MAKRKSNKILNITLISLFFTTLVLLFFYLPSNVDLIGLRRLLRKVEAMSLSMRFGMTAQSKSDIVAGTLKSKVSQGVYKQIFLVLLDDSSVQKYGSMKIGYDTWGEILNYLNNLENKPKIIWFDLLFRDALNTEKLKEELKRNNLIGQSFFLENFSETKNVSKKSSLSFEPRAQEILKKFELKITNYDKIFTYEIINSSIVDVLDSFGMLGVGNIEKEDDFYSKLPLVFRMQYFFGRGDLIEVTNVFYPSSPLLAVVKFLDSDISNIVIDKGRVIIKNANYNGKRSDFIIPVDEKLRISINYRGRSKSGFLRSISLKDATRVGLPKNSIVIFGVDIEGLTENKWFSPVGDLTSTEHLAYAIGTILNRDFIYEVPEFINIIYILLLVVLIALFSGRKAEFVTVAAIFAIVIPLIVGFGLFFLKIKIITFIPLIVGVITLVTGQIYLLLTEEKEKKLIRATFSKYVSPEFVNILIQNPDFAKTGGEETEVTMLFSDIRSFTTISEKMSARELVDFLNNYLSRMTDIILKNKGTLDKYIGDAIVAFWGMPIKLEDHAYYGCLSAVKMIKALNEFNMEMERQGKTKINIGIGLNTGKVIVGNIGSEKKMNYTAIGDTATIAEELQDENKTYNTNIIISEFTYEKVKNHAKVRELGEYSVKGREKPIKIYELIDVVE